MNTMTYKKLRKKTSVSRGGVFCLMILSAIIAVSPLRAVKYVHQRSSDNDVNAIYVSRSVKHTFPQDSYTYTFIAFDKDDVRIVESLGKVFGDGTHASCTYGTYSIAIDYTIGEDDNYVHKQTGYLVSSDSTSVKKSQTKPSGNAIKKDGRILFKSGGNYSPQYLTSKMFGIKDTSTTFEEATEPHHMENALLLSLYHNTDFFDRIKGEIPPSSQILGVTVKLYSSYDFCDACRANVLKLHPHLLCRFADSFEMDPAALPLSLIGLNFRLYGLDYEGSEGEELGEQGYWTALYEKEAFKTFAGVVRGTTQQTRLPIHVFKQPETESGEKLFLTL